MSERPASAARDVAFLLSLALLSAGTAGAPADAVRLVGGLLVCAFLSPAVFAQRAGVARRVALGVISSLALVAAARGAPGPLLLCGAVLLTTRNAAQDNPPVRPEPYLAASLGTMVAEVWYRHFPYAWHVADALSRGYVSAADALWQTETAVGPTVLGLRLLMPVGLYALARVAWSGQPPAAWRLAGLAAIGAVPVVSLGLLGPLRLVAGRALHVGIVPAEALQLVTLALGTTLCLLVTLSLPSAPPPRPGWRPAMAAGLATLCLASGLGVLAWPRPQNPVDGSIAFIDKSGLDWRLPVFGRYGRGAGGMFGLLPDYLRLRGYRTVRLAEALTPSALAGVRVLVIINPSEGLSDAEQRYAWDFVARGGSLLALGDHTGVEGIREPLNHLLTPVGIAYNFDSAKPRHIAWVDGMEWFPHPVTRVLRTPLDTGISVGASLDVAARARPLVVGTCGWSDRGDVTNADAGFLGDMKHAPAERFGDIVLVAVARHGRGKVLAFGDTSTFQNGALSYTSEYVDAVFDWLTAADTRRALVSNWALAAVLLAGALVLLGQSGYNAWAMAAIVAVGYGALAAAGRAMPTGPAGPPAGARVALVDVSHLEGVDKLGFDNSLYGLQTTLMRMGYLPRQVRRPDPRALEVAQVVVIVAPAKPFTRRETAALQEFVMRGGVLFLAAGWTDSAPAEALLSAFGVKVLSTPLGPVRTTAGAHEVSFQDAWPVDCSLPGAASICSQGEAAVLMEARCGKGRLIVCGDTRFLMDMNLESQLPGAETHVSNVEFVRDLIGGRDTGGR